MQARQDRLHGRLVEAGSPVGMADRRRPRGGSLFLVLTPQELVARMATLVTPPRVHGLFAPHAKERSRVVPVAAPELATTSAPSSSGQPRLQAAKTLRTYRLPWALLLRKVFALDVLRCPGCGGTMQVLAVVADTAIAKRILDHLNLDSTGPPISVRAHGPPDLCYWFYRDDYATGAKYAEIAARKPGASTNISRLALSLAAKSGTPEDAIELLRELKATVKDEVTMSRLDEQLKRAFLERDAQVLERAAAQLERQRGWSIASLELS